MSSLDVIYSHPGGRGWGQIERLAELAASELGGRLLEVDASRGFPRLHTARGVVPASRSSLGTDSCLVIAPHPAHLSAILSMPQWRRRYTRAVGWVIDSFWIDRIPRVARVGSYFDHIYVTGHEDVDAWSSVANCPVSALPWGTDALALPFRSGNRSIDLLRVGRQPNEWDDDATTAAAAARLGLHFAGRPAFGANDLESRMLADQAISEAKFVLAFSNLSHASAYTHPTREYLTGRWLDSLAGGASVVGIAPKTQSTTELLWPGALLELTTTQLAKGLQELQEATSQWVPEQARENRRHSLQKLDWRHRLATIRDTFNLTTPSLDASLRSLNAAAESL